MWKKKAGIQLPKAEGSFYLDLKTLQTFKNSESVTIKRVTCGRGTFTVLKTSNKRSRMFLGTSVDVVKETFIHYERLDGKFEEIRLDHLCQNGYAVPDITNNDQVFYGDIKRALMDTSYYLTAVETDWPTQNKKYFKKSQKEQLEKDGIDMFFIRANQVFLSFETDDDQETSKKWRISLSDLYQNVFQFPSKKEAKSVDQEMPCTSTDALNRGRVSDVSNEI